LKIDGATANLLVAVSLLIGTPFFLFFGWLSDRVGRKPIILAGCLIAALTYFPLFKALTEAGNPVLARALATSPVQLVADPRECSFQFNPTGTTKFTSSCDIAKQALANASVNYESIDGAGPAVVHVGELQLTAPADTKGDVAFREELGAALSGHGYPAAADPAGINKPLVVAILTLLVIYVTMVYGPIAAALVEMFPTRIRYTSMSLPYHVGNGWFGGLLPTTAFAIVAQTGNIYSGLWYPVGIAGMTFLIGALFIRDNRGRDLHH